MTAALARYGWWESAEMDRHGEVTAAWAATILAHRFGDSPISGLYLATSDAGAGESIDFWRSALDTGLGFASPQPFPWTLANSPTGQIAQRLDVRGPTYTLVGSADALAAAAGHALADIANGAERALLVALDGLGPRRVTLAAVELQPPSPAGEATLSRETLDGWDDAELATTALRRLIERVAGVQ